MSCTAKDILVIQKAKDIVGILNTPDLGLVSDFHRAKITEIYNILDSIHEISIDDELDAIKVALEEIRDR